MVSHVSLRDFIKKLGLTSHVSLRGSMKKQRELTYLSGLRIKPAAKPPSLDRTNLSGGDLRGEERHRLRLLCEARAEGAGLGLAWGGWGGVGVGLLVWGAPFGGGLGPGWGAGWFSGVLLGPLLSSGLRGQDAAVAGRTEAAKEPPPQNG